MLLDNTANPDDLMSIAKIVETGEATVSDEQAAKLTALGYVDGEALTQLGRRLHDNMNKQREEIRELLRAGRSLSAADLRMEHGEVPLVQFEDATEVDADIYMRAVVGWMCQRGELRYDHETNRYVLTDR